MQNSFDKPETKRMLYGVDKPTNITGGHRTGIGLWAEHPNPTCDPGRAGLVKRFNLLGGQAWLKCTHL